MLDRRDKTACILADNLGEFDQPSMVEDAPIPRHVAEDSGVMT